MERAQYTVTIDIVNTGVIKTQIRLKQGDSGTPLHIKVENNGNPYYDTNMLPQVYFRRPDGTTVIGNTQAGSDNKYLYIFRGNELNASGSVLADVKFKHDNNGRESTSTFMFECLPDTIGKNTETSKTEWNDITEALNKAEEIFENAEETIETMTKQAQIAAEGAEAATEAKESAERDALDVKEYAEQTAEAAERAVKAASSAEATVDFARAAEESATRAQEAASEAVASEQNAKESELKAKEYAETAGDASSQPDWNETDTTSKAFIKNKPSIPSYVVDSSLSSTSTNPVQNKVVYTNITNLNNSIGNKYGRGSNPEFGPTVRLGSGTQYGTLNVDSNVMTIRAPGNTGVGAGLQLLSCASGVYPEVSANSAGVMNLGSPNRKFGTIYSVATALNSDAKLKKDIKPLCDNMDAMLQVFDNLEFVRFRWAQNMNGGMVDPPSSRYHLGFIAQPVENVLKNAGFNGGDSGIMQTNFFADNTTRAWIAGGYQPPKDGYDYSQNVWNYKHGLEYEWINEIIEKDFSEFNVTKAYEMRKRIGYIMFEDISKVQAENGQPPLRIRGVYLVSKDGNLSQIPLSDRGVAYYEHDTDEGLEKPLSSAEECNDYVEIRFNKMWAAYMLEVPTFDFDEYQTLILDIDYVGEYKCYLIPEGEYKNANVWDRDNNDQILYDYSLNYNEIYTLCLYALQETRKEFLEYKQQTSKEIEELKAMIKKGCE